MMFRKHRRYQNRSFDAIVTAVMITAVLAVHERGHGQADYYVCESACTSPLWMQSSSTDLHDVLANLAQTGDIIWVAQGEYHPVGTNPFDIENSFELKAGISIYGNFIGNEEDLDEREPLNDTYETILDGTLASGSPAVKVLHVVHVSGNDAGLRYIDGFTIRNGHARGYVVECDEHAPVPPAHANKGGGMLVTGRNAAIIMCTFEGNVAGSSVCPILQGASSNCNTGTHYRGFGGAMALIGDTTQLSRKVEVYNCVFRDNVAQTGTFGFSSEGPLGGAMYKEGGFGTVEVMNSLFTGNVVDASPLACFGSSNDSWPAHGGAMAFGRLQGTCFGGGIASRSDVWNCTVYGNEVWSNDSASRSGAGL